MVELFANSGDPDQTPRSAASDLGLLCLPITLLGVSRVHWVKIPKPNDKQWRSYGPLIRFYTVCKSVCFGKIKALICQELYTS